MKRYQNFLIGIAVLILIFITLNFFGIIKVNLTRRSLYAGCNAGCNTDLSNINDCIDFLVYLKETQPEFVSKANTLRINLDKPDKVTKTVSTDGHVKCWYWANY